MKIAINLETIVIRQDRVYATDFSVSFLVNKP